MSQIMFGVVLWTDRTDSKAVIWCEDHGDLAYWHQPEMSLHEGAPLDVGDLVQFEMTQGVDLRLATNPERLESKQFFGLAQSLRRAGPAQAQAPGEQLSGADVLPFPARGCRERNVA